MRFWRRTRGDLAGAVPFLRGNKIRLLRLFQPFATAGKAAGIGLGLAFSRQAVIDHGGEMWVESSSRGACFSIRLPRTIHNGARRIMLILVDQKCAELGQRRETIPEEALPA